MWAALREIARREACRVHDICSLIHLRKKPHTSLTAGIRVFLMLYYRAAATEAGHAKAGHGDFDSMLQRARITRASLGGGGMSPSVPSGPDCVAGRIAGTTAFRDAQGATQPLDYPL